MIDKEYFKSSFRESCRNSLYQVVKYNFPEVNNLRILDSRDGQNFIIRFDEGDYKKDFVELKLAEIMREYSKSENK